MYSDSIIAYLSDFFAVCHALLRPNKVYWFRGHSSLKYRLKPSALRYPSAKKRAQALSLVSELRRYLDMKLARPPERDDDLGWMQVAQHYGLPTRLLDWTENAAVALFFACHSRPNSDGLVAILKPEELNQSRDPKTPWIYNPQRDAGIIAPFFKLDGKQRVRGEHTIAINPAWNTERIAQQRGAFTLHGSRQFELDRSQASSLLYVPILHEYKESLLNELERVGIGEMFIFPEPEHVCSHLLRNARL
jgi:hypothetical protein